MNRDYEVESQLGAMQSCVASWELSSGAIGGVVAGAVLAAFETILAALAGGLDAILMPLRMVGAIVLGWSALDPGYPLLNAAIAGLVVHGLLSAAYGAVLGMIVTLAPVLARPAAAGLGTGLCYGSLVWLLNFFVIAPAADWTWFIEETNPSAQFVAHTAFYGATLGLYLALSRPRRVRESRFEPRQPQSRNAA